MEAVSSIVKNDPPLRSTVYLKAQIAEFHISRFSRQILMGLLLALIAVAIATATLIWKYTNVTSDVPLLAVGDLSKLFKEGSDSTLNERDLLNLRDHSCTRVFSLRITQRVFMELSRNCQYSVHVDGGRARINFLNNVKGSVELAPGRSLSGTDFWSIRPITPESDIRLEPIP
jgi:hypothetical protein